MIDFAQLGPRRLWQVARRGMALQAGACAFVVLVCLAVIGHEALHIRDQRLDVFEDGRKDTSNLARSLTQHAEDTFRTIDGILIGIVERVETEGKDQAALERLHRLFQSQAESLPQLKGLSVLDEDGTMLVNSLPSNQRLNYEDRDYFHFHRGSTDRGIHISPPVRSKARSGNDWLIPVTRRINHPDGSFAGVVTASVDPSYFQKFYDTIEIGAQGAILLASGDGILLVRRPFDETKIGRSLADGAIFHDHLPYGPTGSAEMKSSTDGVGRLNSYRRSSVYPLVVAVAEATNDILAPWWQSARLEMLRALALAAIIAVLGLALWRRTKALSVQSALLRASLDNMLHGLIVVDHDDRVAICNRRARELLDLPEGLMASRPRSQEVLDDQAAAGEFAGTPAELRQQLGKRHIPATELYERRRPNGTILEIQSVPFAEGGVVRTYKDITRQKQVERELKDREARYRLLADNSTDMIFRLDLEFVRQYVSPASLEILGYSPEELVGTRPLEMIHPEDAALVSDIYRAVADGLERASVTNRIRHRDGRWIWVEAELRLVRETESDRPAGILGALRDITSRKAIEAEAAAARLQAERAAAAQGQFLATMSHELRTPLSSILGFADVILVRDDLMPEIRRQISLIRIASDSVLTIVNDILDFSKIEEGRLELSAARFEFATLIDTSMAIIEGSACEKHLRLEAETDRTIPAHLVGDDNRLRQILLNLLNNAVKFTRSGRITLSVRLLASSEGGNRLRFAVSDTGIGIPSDKLGHLFRRFSQIDGSISREFGGTGLGLAICKRLVELMGGEIGVESEVGKGSTFWFAVTLPTAPDDESHISAVPPRSLEGRVARILLVEDGEANREIARSMLEAEGHEVDGAPDGVEAILAAEARSYDLVLMDIQMPGMDGIEAARIIRRLPGAAGSVPIIAMTANVLPRQIDAFRAAGINGHVAKPFRRKDLLTAVEQGLADEIRSGDAPAAQSKIEPCQLDAAALEAVRTLIGPRKTDELLGKFAAELGGSLTREAAGGSIFTPSAGEAHSLASSAGMFGFHALSQSCRKLETALMTGEDATACLEEVRIARQLALAQIKMHLGSKRASGLAQAGRGS